MDTGEILGVKQQANAGSTASFGEHKRHFRVLL